MSALPLLGQVSLLRQTQQQQVQDQVAIMDLLRVLSSEGWWAGCVE